MTTFVNRMDKYEATILVIRTSEMEVLLYVLAVRVKSVLFTLYFKLTDVLNIILTKAYHPLYIIH